LETNDGKNSTWLPCITLHPSLDELPAALTWVEQKMPPGTKVKAGGSQHSLSKSL
jgi:hypothetical protein